MTDKPIIMSAESVRAILAGRKTQTRRVIKPQPYAIIDGLPYVDNPVQVVDESNGKIVWRYSDDSGRRLITPARCPYAPGDRLWVREAWFSDPPYDGTWDQYAFSDGTNENFAVLPERFKTPEFVLYRASWAGPDLRWRSPIHMPRWASRLTLEVVNVRMERVQDITQSDAKAEGADPWFNVGDGEHIVGPGHTEYSIEYCPEEKRDYRMGYQFLWDALNAKRGYPWDANPWVWVITFKVVTL